MRVVAGSTHTHWMGRILGQSSSPKSSRPRYPIKKQRAPIPPDVRDQDLDTLLQEAQQIHIQQIQQDPDSAGILSSTATARADARGEEKPCSSVFTGGGRRRPPGGPARLCRGGAAEGSPRESCRPRTQRQLELVGRDGPYDDGALLEEMLVGGEGSVKGFGVGLKGMMARSPLGEIQRCHRELRDLGHRDVPSVFLDVAVLAEEPRWRVGWGTSLRL
ncbi:unnamed protein product [Arctogadus glacialis]